MSFAKYSKPRRAAANVESVSAWVGDFDRGALSVCEISSRLKSCSHAIYSSYSHSAPVPKYRVIVPYSRPVTVEEHAKLFEHFAGLFGEAVDTSTRDPCRLWFFPSCAADGEGCREWLARP